MLELTGPHSLTHEEMVTIIGDVLGRPLRYQEVPAQVAAQAMVDRCLPEPFVTALLARYARGDGQPELVTDEVDATADAAEHAALLVADAGEAEHSALWRNVQAHYLDDTPTLGLLLTVVVLSAGIQDRDGAKPALLETYLRTGVRFVFADGAFAGRLLEWADTILRTTLHIVRKPADQRGFAVIPRRWAVERTFAWITAHRRLARDYERDPAVSEAMIRWAAINTITRRIARGTPATR